ncbi:hypothetical protein LJC13_00795 [Peptostreptococcaceae bacterium OttesenSCG-928-C18]|nr:hypothetical protein [Peptostreptococcaceae bacterium OttesenSCG-928-C18]
MELKVNRSGILTVEDKLGLQQGEQYFRKLRIKISEKVYGINIYDYNITLILKKQDNLYEFPLKDYSVSSSLFGDNELVFIKEISEAFTNNTSEIELGVRFEKEDRSRYFTNIVKIQVHKTLLKGENLGKILEKYRGKNIILLQEKEELTTERDELKTRLEELQEDLAQKSEENTVLSQEVERLSVEITDLNNRINEVNHELETGRTRIIQSLQSKGVDIPSDATLKGIEEAIDFAEIGMEVSKYFDTTDKFGLFERIFFSDDWLADGFVKVIPNGVKVPANPNPMASYVLNRVEIIDGLDCDNSVDYGLWFSLTSSSTLEYIHLYNIHSGNMSGKFYYNSQLTTAILEFGELINETELNLSNAFEYDAKLKHAVIQANDPITNMFRTFAECTELEKVTVTGGFSEALLSSEWNYQNCFAGCVNLDIDYLREQGFPEEVLATAPNYTAP